MCLTVEFCLEGYYLSLVKQAEIQDKNPEKSLEGLIENPRL